MSKPKPLLKKTCPQCGSEFETNLKSKKYCDSICARNFNRRKQRFGKPKKTYVMKHPQKVQCCVCAGEFTIDNPCSHKETPIFYCTNCLKKHGGKSVLSPILFGGKHDGGSVIIVPELNLNLERER